MLFLLIKNAELSVNVNFEYIPRLLQKLRLNSSQLLPLGDDFSVTGGAKSIHYLGKPMPFPKKEWKMNY